MNLTASQHEYIMQLWRRQGDTEFYYHPIENDGDMTIARQLEEIGLVDIDGALVQIIPDGVRYCSGQPV